MGQSPKLPASHSKNFFCQSSYKYVTSAYYRLCKPFCKKSYLLTTSQDSLYVQDLTGPIFLICKENHCTKNKAQLMCYNPVCTNQIPTTKSSNSKDVFFYGKNLSDFNILNHHFFYHMLQGSHKIEGFLKDSSSKISTVAKSGRTL